MASLATIGTIATIASAGITAVGTIATGQARAEQAEAQGRAAQQAAEFEAAQLDIKSKEEQAAAQQEMLQLRRRKKLALSSLQARSAGSGFSATDPTSLALGDEISQFGTLQEQMAMFGGRSRAEGLSDAAAGRRFSGASALRSGRMTASATRTGSLFGAGSTIMGGVETMADRFARRSRPGASGGRYG